MSIECLFRVQCKPCERYLPRPGGPRVALEDSQGADLFTSYTSAYDEAVRRGWGAYPLLCPDCTEDLKAKVRNGPQDGRPVRQPDQSP